MKKFELRRWLAMPAIFFSLTLQACSPHEIPGTYDVEIEIAGVSATLAGTLILSAGILEIPPLAEADRAMLGEWFVGDTLDANSCFILRSPSGTGQISEIVRVFETQMRGNEIVMPIEIFRTPSDRIEIIDLKFFANTAGGEVVFHDGDRQRGGRIGGARLGSPSAERCLKGLEAFRSDLRASLQN